MNRSRLAVATVVAVLVVGCGQGAAPAPLVVDQQTLASAVSATELAGTARISIEMTAAMSPIPEPLRVVMQGATDLKGERASLRYTVSGMPSLASPQTGGEGQFLMLDRDTAFVSGPLARGPFMGEPLPAGIEWVATDPSVVGSGPVSMPAPGGADPAQYLDWLRQAVGEVEEVGPDEQRGVPTTHLRATATFLDLMDEQTRQTYETMTSITEDVPEGLREQFQGIYDAMRELPVRFDVWVDGDQLLRRAVVLIDMTPMYTAMGVDEGGELRMDMQLFDFGTPFTVEAPDPDTVIDVADLHRQLGSSGEVESSVSTLLRSLPAELSETFSMPSGAQLTNTQVDDGLVAATWVLPATDDPVPFDRLVEMVDQSLRAGAWDVTGPDVRSEGSSQEVSMQLRGHGYDGMMVIIRTGEGAVTTFQLTLVAR